MTRQVRDHQNAVISGRDWASVVSTKTGTEGAMTPSLDSLNSAPARSARRPFTSLSSIDTRAAVARRQVERIGLSGRSAEQSASSPFNSSL